MPTILSNISSRLLKGKLATKCPHRDLVHYAHGMCKECYQQQYKRKRKQNKSNPIF